MQNSEPHHSDTMLSLVGVKNFRCGLGVNGATGLIDSVMLDIRASKDVGKAQLQCPPHATMSRELKEAHPGFCVRSAFMHGG